jgi:SAM-dependent methyltransferase
MEYEQLMDWFSTPLGRSIVSAEQRVLADFLPRCFGYHLLQIGGPAEKDLTYASPILHKVRCSEDITQRFVGDTVQAGFETIPFQAESVDVLLVSHVLEYVDQPKAFLSDLSHLLVPGGYLIVCAFNPYSLWGIAKNFTQALAPLPWQGKFVSSGKVKRWLQQCDLTFAAHKSMIFRPPLIQQSSFNRWLFFEAVGQLCWPFCGGVYMLAMKKQMVPMQPIIEPLRKTKSPLGSAYPEPTRRNL